MIKQVKGLLTVDTLIPSRDTIVEAYAIIGARRNTLQVEKQDSHYRIYGNILLKRATLYWVEVVIRTENYTKIVERKLVINKAVSSMHPHGHEPSSLGLPKSNTGVHQVESTKSRIFDYYPSLPLVSVMLPVYNHAEFAIKSVESVRRQTYSNWELVIIDDGSKDNLLELLKPYLGDPRIRVYTQRNQKLPRALTHLHQFAVGRFLTWTSADNIMEPDMLEHMVAFLLENPECTLCYGDVTIIDKHDNLGVSISYRDRERDLTRRHIVRLPRDAEPLGAENDNYINACFMYRRESSDALEGQYASDLTGIEDYDYWLRLSRAGDIKHISRDEPLYRYRVHEKTMSEDLLKNKLKLHSERLQKFIAFEQTRATLANRPWNVRFTGPSLVAEPPTYANGKILEIGTKPVNAFTNENTINAWSDENNYHLKLDSGRIITVSTGAVISPLALKSKYIHPDLPYWEYVKMGSRFVIGIHEDISRVDKSALVAIIAANKNLFFVICDTAPTDGARGSEICGKNENSIYVGFKPFGQDYSMYSSWTAVLHPPMIGEANHLGDHSKALAWSCGRWLLFPQSYSGAETSPGCVGYVIGSALPPVWKYPSLKDVPELIRQHSVCLRPENRLEQFKKLCDAVIQDKWLGRPDFAEAPPPVFQPIAVPIGPSYHGKSGYLAFLVDHFDKGGLEQVIAMLALRMKMRGLQVRVLCTQAGGLVADATRAQGIEVQVFNGDKAAFRRYLENDKPQAITSHYAHHFLDVTTELVIPVIETIHNMYAFFGPDEWKRELERSVHFKKLVAVSETVKNYYLRHNPTFDPSRVVVIGNAAEYRRINGRHGALTRLSLDIPDNAYVLLNVSSFDWRKNHLGLISSFAKFLESAPEAILVLAGNILSTECHNAVVDYIKEIGIMSNIRVLDYTPDIGGLYAMADVFVMPSYIEGWSISATEAAYAGLPIIHSDCGSGRELCGNDGERGILIENPAGNPIEMTREIFYARMFERSPSNTTELTRAIIRVYNDRTEWQAKRNSIKSHALTEFGIDKMVDAYAALLLS